MGQEDNCKETNAEDGLVKFGSLVEEESCEVSLNGVLNDFVGFDVKISSLVEEEDGEVGLDGVLDDSDVKIGSLVEEENGEVGLDGVLNDSVDFDVKDDNGISEGVDYVEKDVKRSDGIVGVEGTEVKSGKILSVECGGKNCCEIVNGQGDGIIEGSGSVGSCRISGNTLTIGSDGTKSSEEVSDGENSDGASESEVSGESEASSESDSDASSESEASSESDSDASSESESETSSLSLSPSSSDEEEEEEEEEEEDEEEEDDDKDGRKGKALEEGKVDVNEMIEELIVRELFDFSDEEEEEAFAMAGLFKVGLFGSANKVKVLPPVPPVAVTLQPCHETLPVGVVSSVVGVQVIVEGVEKHNPLNEGSILWITEKRSPLGIVDEIFGPVKNPYYIVRYNSDNEVPTGIQQGTLISFVSEFGNHVLNNGNENDEELSDEAEFSDDEKEREYKRMQKVYKRRPKTQNVNNRKDTENKAKRRGDQHLSATQPNKRVGQVSSNQSHHFPPSSLLDPGNYSNSMRPVQAFPGGPEFVPMFPQVTQVPNFVAPYSGIWMNGISFQPLQSMGFPNGSPNMLQLQQHYAQQYYQMLSFNRMPLQQQFNTGQMFPSNFVLPSGQPNFGAGVTVTPMNPMMMGNNNFSQWHATMGQNNFIQSHAATNMQGQQGMNFSQAQSPLGMQGQHGMNFSQAQSPLGMQGQHGMNFSQAQSLLGMQGHHVPAFTNQGEQGVLLSGCQSEQNSNSQPLSATSSSSEGSQDFSNAGGVGLARNSHQKEGGLFGGGRGR